MPAVLTIASNVSCGHDPGKVATTGSPKLKINGSAVLLKTGIIGKGVSGCVTPASNTSKTCTAVVNVSAGEATKLKVGGQAVMLEATLVGDTDGVVGGTPQKLLKATANQSKCTAI